MAFYEAMTKVLATTALLKDQRTRTTPQAVDDAHDRATLSCEKVLWPDIQRNVVSVLAEVSFDAGKTWELLAGFTAGGATPTLPESISPHPTVSVPMRPGTNRQIRVTIDAIEALTTNVSFESRASGEPIQPGEQPHSVAFDAVSSTDYASVSSVSWTHTPSGTPSNVGVSVNFAAFAAATISTITYGGTGCAVAVTVSQATSFAKRSSIWELESPASGAKTVAITWSAGSNTGAAGAITIVGGDATQTFSNTASASGSTGTTATVNCTSAVGELVMDALFNLNNTPPTVGADQTQRYNRQPTSEDTNGATSTEPGAASVTMSWTIPNGYWTLAAASFKAAAAAATNWRLPLLGVG